MATTYTFTSIAGGRGKLKVGTKLPHIIEESDNLDPISATVLRYRGHVGEFDINCAVDTVIIDGVTHGPGTDMETVYDLLNPLFSKATSSNGEPGSTPNLQEVLTQGSTLTTDNTINPNGHVLNIISAAVGSQLKSVIGTLGGQASFFWLTPGAAYLQNSVSGSEYSQVSSAGQTLTLDAIGTNSTQIKLLGTGEVQISGKIRLNGVEGPYDTAAEAETAGLEEGKVYFTNTGHLRRLGDGTDEELGGGGITDITYSALVIAIVASTLTAGAQYRITDYATKHYIVDGLGAQYLSTIITGIAEPLIVTALSANTISSEAKSALHPQDIIHYDWNPANWLNDASFADLTGTPAIIPGFKGVIHFRHDTQRDNYMGYDFRNCKFRRWKMLSHLAFDTENKEYWGANPTHEINGVLPDAADFIDVKTFVESEGFAYETAVKNNHFEPLRDNSLDFAIAQTILDNQVFYLSLSGGWEGYAVVFGNSFANGCKVNTFGPRTYLNIIDDSFYYNTIGSSFRSNTIGNYFAWNCIANQFYFNNIDGYFYENMIGDNCNTNIFGVGFYENTAGAGFQSNTIEANGSVGVDYTAATHVYIATYSKRIFKRLDGTSKLSYYDNSDALTVVNSNE